MTPTPKTTDYDAKMPPGSNKPERKPDLSNVSTERGGGFSFRGHSVDVSRPTSSHDFDGTFSAKTSESDNEDDEAAFEAWSQKCLMELDLEEAHEFKLNARSQWEDMKAAARQREREEAEKEAARQEEEARAAAEKLDEEQSMAKFAQLFAITFKNMMGTVKVAEEVDERFSLEGTTKTSSGLTFRRAGPRNADEIEEVKVVVPREKRGKSVKDRKKVGDAICNAISPKFTLPDYDKILSPDSAETIGSQALDKQAPINAFIKWCKMYDCSYLFKIPVVAGDFTVTSVSSATRHVDLLVHYKDISLETVTRFQAFINTYLEYVDGETSEWSFRTLEESIKDSNLKVQLQQKLEKLPVAHRGGVVLFKLLVDRIDAHTWEATQATLTFLTQTFRLSNYKGEDVSTTITQFTGAVKLLNTRDIPKDIITYFVNGLSQCSNKEFHDTCIAQKGFMSTPIYAQWVADKGAQDNPAVLLDYFSSTLLSKYEALKANFKWTGAAAKQSSFTSQSLSQSHTQDRSALKARHGSWVEWFDRQTCTVPGCNKNHPTKYHDDPGIRDRPFVPFKDRKQQATRQSNGRPFNRTRFAGRPTSAQPSRTPRFKSKEAKDKAMKAIHNVLLECVEDDDKVLLANIGEIDSADDEEPEIEMEIHNVMEDEASEGDDEDDDDDGMDAARALAAISLNKMLLN